MYLHNRWSFLLKKKKKKKKTWRSLVKIWFKIVSLFTELYFGKEVGGEQVTVTQGQA